MDLYFLTTLLGATAFGMSFVWAIRSRSFEAWSLLALSLGLVLFGLRLGLVAAAIMAVASIALFVGLVRRFGHHPT